MKEPISVICAHPRSDVFPLALGMCLASARKALAGEPFDLEPRFVRTPSELGECLTPGGRNVLLCSNNILTIDHNFRLSRYAKACDPRCITIHGGPSTPAFADACELFLREHPEVDFAVRGEGEITLVDLLRAIHDGNARRQAVPGVSTLDGRAFRRHPDRPPIQNLDALPSPYLTGLFDGLTIDQETCASVETNRGCPYACAFCSWSSVPRGRPRVFSVERVRAEVEWLARRKVEVLILADSNFGILDRDVELAEIICAARRRFGAPQATVIEYARSPMERLAMIAAIFARSGIINSVPISVQSRDPQTLKTVGRPTSIRDYDRLEAALIRMGIGCTAFLMLGLPGSTARSFLNDLRYYFDAPTMTMIPRTIVLPNSPMAEPSFLARHRIRTDSGGYITETATLKASEMLELQSVACLYGAVQNCGVLRYVLCWLQWDKGIDALEVLKSLALDPETPQRFPLLGAVLAESGADILSPHAEAIEHIPSTRQAWDALHEAVASWLAEKLNIESDPALRTVLQAQSAVMTVNKRNRPAVEEFPCDIVRWYRDRKRGQGRLLRDYPPGTLRVKKTPQYGFHWEQDSPLMRIRLSTIPERAAASSAVLTPST